LGGTIGRLDVVRGHHRNLSRGEKERAGRRAGMEGGRGVNKQPVVSGK